KTRRMTDKRNTYSIIKVATALGVAVGTVADHLESGGFDVDGKPTTKITQEMYDILLRDFKSDKAARDEAKQLEINKAREERVVTDISDKPKKPATPETNDFDDELVLIKNATVNPVKTPKDPEPEPEKKVEEPKQEKEEPEPEVQKEEKEEHSDSRVEVK